MKQVRLLSEIVPNDWKIETLDKLTDVIFVGTDPVGGRDSHSDVKTDYRIIQSSPVHDGYIDITKVGYVDKNIYDSLISVSIKDNDVLLNQLGNGATFARSCVAQRNILPAIITRSVGCIRCNPKKLDPWFLNAYLVLPSTKKYIESFDSGSSRRAIDGSKMKQFLIPHPINIEAQRKIGKFYKTILDKIEVNNKINHELEAMAKTIYDYWFVQFDFPDANGKPYKSSGGKMVYNKELKREIPKDWDKGTLDDIAKIVRGVSYNKHDIKTPNDEGVTPVLRATNITGNILDLENMVYVPDEFVSEKQLMNKYDVLITMSSGSKDHIGKNGMFYFDKKIAFGAFCAKLEAKDDYQFYLSSYMQSNFISETIKKECLGTSINNLNGSMVKGFRLVKPNKDVLKSYNKKLKPIHDKIGSSHKQNQKLTELCDWLLPMLINGQVTFDEAKEQLGMVAEQGEEYY